MLAIHNIINYFIVSILILILLIVSFLFQLNVLFQLSLFISFYLSPNQDSIILKIQFHCTFVLAHSNISFLVMQFFTKQIINTTKNTYY